MASVLHLLGLAADEQTRQIHDLLVHRIGPAYHSSTHTVGAGGTYRNLPAAVLKLRQEKPDITCAWGTAALAAAVLSKHPRILFGPDGFAGPRALRWIRLLMKRGKVTMVCPTFTQQRLAIANGIESDRCVVIQPGVDIDLRTRRDPALRAALGFAETDFVLLAPGESTIATGHEHAVWTTLILYELNPAFRLLMWGRGARSDSVLAMPRRLGMTDLVTQAEQKLGRPVRFEELLSVADACLVTPSGVVPTLPIVAAMAAGVPIISTTTRVLGELLVDEKNALMVPKRSPRALVQRVLDLRGDAGLRDRIVNAARADAQDSHSVAGMLGSYRDLLEGNHAEHRTLNIEHRTSNIEVKKARL